MATELKPNEERIVVQTFPTSHGLYNFLYNTDMQAEKERLTEIYGKHRAEIDTDTGELVIIRTKKEADSDKVN